MRPDHRTKTIYSLFPPEVAFAAALLYTPNPLRRFRDTVTEPDAAIIDQFKINLILGTAVFRPEALLNCNSNRPKIGCVAINYEPLGIPDDARRMRRLDARAVERSQGAATTVAGCRPDDCCAGRRQGGRRGSGMIRTAI